MLSLERLVRRGRARTIAIWAGSILALYAILGFFVAPPIVRSQLERVLTDLLGRPAAIERIRINPFAFSASMSPKTGADDIKDKGKATRADFSLK